MAPAGNRKDKNPTKAPPKDRLTREELAQQYGYALQLIYSVPELQRLFEQAVNQQWTRDKFIAEFQNSAWYNNNDQFYRRAWTAEQMGGGDWQNGLREANAAVQQAAAQAGADLTPEELAALSRRYVYEGWGAPGRDVFLSQALSEEITFLPTDRGGVTARGKAGNFVDNLRSIATANGLRYSDDWYLSAARSVNSRLTTEDDWIRDLREQAASLYPNYGDQIRAGISAQDLASPYINLYAQTMEVSPYEITLNNGDVKRAMLEGMGLADFQQMLRDKPEWMNTKQAEDSVSEISLRVMKMFGLVGS